MGQEKLGSTFDLVIKITSFLFISVLVTTVPDSTYKKKNLSFKLILSPNIQTVAKGQKLPARMSFSKACVRSDM